MWSSSCSQVRMARIRPAMVMTAAPKDVDVAGDRTTVPFVRAG